MAQIVTITNPLTGQPAQVDQLDHTAQQIDDAIARALPGGGIDTLLAGKAPAGYGLGESQGRFVTNTSVDTLTKNGWYYLYDGVTGGPSGLSIYHAILFVSSSRSDLTKVQRLILATGGRQGQELRRVYKDGSWLPWEWIDPPMELGVEHRTTERYMGKPVYVKLIDVGQMPNTDQLLVSANIGNNSETTVISFDGYMDNGVSIDKFPVFWSPGELKAYMFVMVYGNKWHVGVRSLVDLSAYTAKCLIKYTKIEG